MNVLTKTVSIGALILGMVANSQAILITAGTTPAVATGPETSQAQIDAILAVLIPGMSEVYKQDVGGPESGAFAASYQTTFGDPLLLDEDFTITYQGGSLAPITTVPVYLLVKDGAHDPAWYLYNLTSLGWTGTETIQGQNFWPQQGGISHVAIYAGGTTTRVPDGGSTLLLLGSVMAALGLARRRLS